MKLTIHPLFFVAGLIATFTGDLLLFIMATLAAIEHELAHAFAARRAGYALSRIVLMPYGAVIKGDISELSLRNKIYVLAAGPIANGLTALLFVALWWLFPETYPYTDVAAYVSFSLFLVNLLPAYPLDGGRILRAALMRLGKKKSVWITRGVSILIMLAILGYFIYSCFSAPNFSALFFALCIGVGSLGGGAYAHVRFSRKKQFVRGIQELRIAISADCPFCDAIRYFREDKYLVLVLFDGENFLGELAEEELFPVIDGGNWNRPLREILFAQGET